MNQKTNFIGTGAQIAALGTTYAGQLAFCTSTGSGFIADKSYRRNTANDAWNLEPSRDQQPYLKLSTTIGDYSQPSTAVASSFVLSDSTSDVTNGISATTDSDLSTLTGASKITGLVENSQITHVAVNIAVATGNFRFAIYADSTGAPGSLLAQTTGGAYSTGMNYIAVTSPYTVSSGDAANGVWIAVQHSSSSGRVEVLAGGASASRKQVSVTYGTGLPDPFGSASDSTSTLQVGVRLYIPLIATRAVDDSTSTAWESNSEANPNIYVDLSSAREVVGIAINLNTVDTTVTTLKIRGSTDTSFADSENIIYVNVSDFTDNTWRYLPNNFLPTNVRYIQVYAVETGVLSVYEIKVRYGVSDTVKLLGLRIGTRQVDSVDSFVDSD